MTAQDLAPHTPLPSADWVPCTDEQFVRFLGQLAMEGSAMGLGDGDFFWAHHDIEDEPGTGHSRFWSVFSVSHPNLDEPGSTVVASQLAVLYVSDGTGGLSKSKAFRSIRRDSLLG